MRPRTSARSALACRRRAGLRRIVALSILGADEASPNACLASRGRADAILLLAKTPAVVIRVPRVLGAGDLASAALEREARGPRTRLVGGGATLERPISARDVVEALVAALTRHGLDDSVLDLAGPEALSHRALVLRAAAVLGTRVTSRIPAPLSHAFDGSRARQSDLRSARVLGLPNTTTLSTPSRAREAGSLTPLDARCATRSGDRRAMSARRAERSRARRRRAGSARSRGSSRSCASPGSTAGSTRPPAARARPPHPT